MFTVILLGSFGLGLTHGLLAGVTMLVDRDHQHAARVHGMGTPARRPSHDRQADAAAFLRPAAMTASHV